MLDGQALIALSRLALLDALEMDTATTVRATANLVLLGSTALCQPVRQAALETESVFQWVLACCVFVT